MDSERNLSGRGASIFHTIALFHTRFTSRWLRDGVIASLDLQICEMLSLQGLLCVISGLLAGRSPGFRTVLCCFFSHKSCMASLFCCGSLFPCFLVALAIPILVNASHFLLQCAIWPPVACNVSLVLVFVCCSLLVFCFVPLCFLFGLFFCFIA